jgi:hypothetical protein
LAQVAKERPMDSMTQQHAKNRLIVVIPDCITNNSKLAYKIYWMAFRSSCDVHYLALVDDAEKESAISRCMATMKAETSASWLNVDVQLVDSKGWVKTLGQVSHPGDTVICLEEQKVRVNFFRKTSAAESLRQALEVPVRTLSGFYDLRQKKSAEWARSLLFWIGCLVIFAGFSMLEVQMDSGMNGLARTAALLVVLFVEISAIWGWTGING